MTAVFIQANIHELNQNLIMDSVRAEIDKYSKLLHDCAANCQHDTAGSMWLAFFPFLSCILKTFLCYENKLRLESSLTELKFLPDLISVKKPAPRYRSVCFMANSLPDTNCYISTPFSLPEVHLSVCPSIHLHSAYRSWACFFGVIHQYLRKTYSPFRCKFLEFRLFLLNTA